MSANERTGWRDEEISRRHRVWGFNCPAVDLDFLMVEYNLGEPVGLVEYKHYKKLSSPPHLNHPTYRALNSLASKAELPFLIAYYFPEFDWAFRVQPINFIAKKFFAVEAVTMDLSEQEFVTILYKIRSQKIETSVLNRLGKSRPMTAIQTDAIFKELSDELERIFQ